VRHLHLNWMLVASWTRRCAARRCAQAEHCRSACSAGSSRYGIWRPPNRSLSEVYAPTNQQSQDARHALMLMRHLQTENKQLAENFDNVRFWAGARRSSLSSESAVNSDTHCTPAPLQPTTAQGLARPAGGVAQPAPGKARGPAGRAGASCVPCCSITIWHYHKKQQHPHRFRAHITCSPSVISAPLPTNLKPQVAIERQYQQLCESWQEELDHKQHQFDEAIAQMTPPA